MSKNNSETAKKAPAKKIISKDSLKRHSPKILSKNKKKYRGNYSWNVKRFQNFYSERGFYKPNDICDHAITNIMHFVTHKFEIEKKDFFTLEAI